MSETINAMLCDAGQFFKEGKHEQAIERYLSAIKITHSKSLSNNIKCTIAIIKCTQGKYQQSIEIMDEIKENIEIDKNCSSMLKIRFLVNAILVEIMTKNNNNVLDCIQSLINTIQNSNSSQNQLKMLQYATFLLFRVKDVSELKNEYPIVQITDLSVSEAYFIFMLCYHEHLIYQETRIALINRSYQVFMVNYRYDLALIVIQFVLQNQRTLKISIEKYQKDYAKLSSLGLISEKMDMEPPQSSHLIKAIAQALISLKSAIKHNNDQKEKTKEQIKGIWKIGIAALMKNILQNNQMSEDQKFTINQNLRVLKTENNILVMKQMMQTDLFQKNVCKIRQTLYKCVHTFEKQLKNVLKYAFTVFKDTKGLKVKKIQDNSNVLKDISLNISNRQNLRNSQTLTISINGSKISKDSNRKKIFITNTIEKTHTKKIAKMLKACQYGTFLNKRNFNSDGGQYKFVRVTNCAIKWGKDPEKIQESYQLYPLKDIKSIVYGKCTPNFQKNSNKILVHSKCFSLLLQKRTLDFYCKDYDEVETWVCGLTQALKKNGNKIVGYTPGKLRWKKMFAILKQKFIDPLKTPQRNKYYYQNAYSLILFARNGYKLPQNR